ncbi:Penicillin-binding protein 2D [compost metagenome]
MPPKLFPVPEGVVNVYIDPVTGKLANDGCPNSRMEAFVEGTEPTEYCAPAQNASSQKDAEGKKQEGSWWKDLKRWWNE